MANLTGKQIERLCDALIAAFDRSELEQMTRIDLEENLEAIAGAGSLRVVVFELVTWAQRTGRVAELLAAAQTRRPTNAALAVLAQELGVAPAAKPDAPSPAAGGVHIGKVEAVNAAIGGTQIIDQRGATFNIGGTKIDTGGGAYVGGNVDTGGGDFVGRDANTPPPANVDALLVKLAATVALDASAANVPQAMAQVARIQVELAKGKEADDAKLAEAVQALLAVAPDAVVAAFSAPVIAGQIGPVTRFVLTRHGAK